MTGSLRKAEDSQLSFYRAEYVDIVLTHTQSFLSDSFLFFQLGIDPGFSQANCIDVICFLWFLLSPHI